MSDKKGLPRSSKVLCSIGSMLLIVMAGFHGSGYSYVNTAIKESNSEIFLKEIVPVLFAHPSIHLVGLAALGILVLFLAQDGGKVLLFLALLVLTDGILAFYLGGTIPGIILVLAAVLFAVSSKRKN